MDLFVGDDETNVRTGATEEANKLLQRIDQIPANRVREGYVNRDAAAEKGRGSLPCAIEELVREDYVHRFQLFAQ